MLKRGPAFARVLAPVLPSFLAPILGCVLIAAASVSPLAASEFFTLKGHGGPIMDIAVDPTSGKIATASFDNSVGLWRQKSATWLEDHRAAVNAVHFIDETKAVSGGDDFAVVLWDLENGQASRFEGHQGKVMGLAASPDQTLIASASWDGSIGLWPLAGGEPAFLTGHQAGVNQVQFSVDGKRLYSASSDGTIRLWDVETRTEVRALLNNGFGINTMLLDPQERWLVYGALDGRTVFVDPLTGETLHDFSLERRPILALALSPDQSLVAVGDGEGYIMVIDTRTWQIVRDFRAARAGPIWALAFSFDGQNIHAGGLEDILYSWPIETLDKHDGMQSARRSFHVDPAEVPNGERQFKRKCSICHSLTPGSQRRAGPSLHGLFGRPAGAVADYRYSDTLIQSEIVWTDETVDALFDIGPDHYIPGTKMPMQRIVKPQDRRDLIDYLKTATTAVDN